MSKFLYPLIFLLLLSCSEKSLDDPNENNSSNTTHSDRTLDDFNKDYPLLKGLNISGFEVVGETTGDPHYNTIPLLHGNPIKLSKWSDEEKKYYLFMYSAIRIMYNSEYFKTQLEKKTNYLDYSYNWEGFSSQKVHSMTSTDIIHALTNRNADVTILKTVPIDFDSGYLKPDLDVSYDLELGKKSSFYIFSDDARVYTNEGGKWAATLGPSKYHKQYLYARLKMINSKGVLDNSMPTSDLFTGQTEGDYAYPYEYYYPLNITLGNVALAPTNLFYVMTHELLHSIGFSHDGDRNTAKAKIVYELSDLLKNTRVHYDIFPPYPAARKSSGKDWDNSDVWTWTEMRMDAPGDINRDYRRSSTSSDSERYRRDIIEFTQLLWEKYELN
ncbi:hypothetical protein K5X82_02410 [Halosquirtibacter xylanolyticus]|uniref:hypothetical protein n=1 Tax=Halosquirtibacter xylanolyticus TaxID=3374599 RepID=UPI003747C572|nr:hypothetical protein K5X82_02410 [Prolixibacteraceae bacterium]